MPEPKAPTSEETEKTPADGSGKDTPPKPEDAKTFTQADLDRIAGEARKSEREKARKEKEDEDKKRAEKELEAQGKLKELADTRERERDAVILERDDYKGKYETLAATVNKSVEAEIKALPEEFRELAPEGLDARLEWLPKAKKMAEKLTGEPKPGNSRGPKPAGETPQDVVQSIYERKRASGQYSR